MTITNHDELKELKELKHIGPTVANIMQAMEPGMITHELDEIGYALLEREGAVSAPQSTYDLPGTTCTSVNEETAHGIPDDRVIAAGDLVNIDISASKNGYFADTGVTYRAGSVRPSLDCLCRDGRRAMQIGSAQVGAARPPAGIGKAIGRFADARLHADPQPGQPRRGPVAARISRRHPDLAQPHRKAPHRQGASSNR